MTATAEQAVPDGARPDDAAPALGGQIRKAALWSGINSIALRLGQFTVGVVSARLIAPRQFGIFAVALTVYAVIINVNELGVSAALARTKRPVDEVAPTVATIAIGSSALFTGAMFVSAPWLAALLGAPDATTAVRLLSLVVFLGGVTAVPYALLVRHFQQDKRFLADGSNFVASTVLVVVLGASGFGATALALSRVAGQLVSMGILVGTIRPRYRPGWNAQYARELLRYSLPLAGATVVEFALGNMDYVVVGRLRGALALGYYNLAYNISGWPVGVFGLMINEVALPAFARAQDDHAGLPRRVRGAFALTAAVSFPVSALCLALAHPLVVAVYGARWSAAAAALAVLGLFGSMRILTTLISNVLAAVGDSRGVLSLQLVWIVTLLPALIVGVSTRGIVGAAVAQEIVAVAVVLPVALRLIARAGGGHPLALIGALARPALASGVAAACAWGVGGTLPGPLLQVAAGGAAGLAVYAALVGRWVRTLVADARAHWDGEAAVVAPPARHRVPAPRHRAVPASRVGRGGGVRRARRADGTKEPA